MNVYARYLRVSGRNHCGGRTGCDRLDGGGVPAPGGAPRRCAAARLATTSTSDRIPRSWAVSPSGSEPTLARYLEECLAVARAEGANLDDDVITQILMRLRNAPPGVATSMLGDREARRPLEWDIRNGVIQRKARKHGLPAPVSEVIVPLLAAASDGPG